MSSSNPGVGLKMTAARISEVPEPDGPGPQHYDVSRGMTEREKAQNELISQRYNKDQKKWATDHRAEAVVKITSQISRTQDRGQSSLQIDASCLNVVGRN